MNLTVISKEEEEVKLWMENMQTIYNAFKLQAHVVVAIPIAFIVGSDV
jgi:hypothetical protein